MKNGIDSDQRSDPKDVAWTTPPGSRRSPALAFFIAAMLLPGMISLVGCGDSLRENEEAEANEPAPLPTIDMVVRLSADMQREIGLVTATMQPQVVSESLESTGWLRSIPGSESSIRAPASGFYVSESESQILTIGQEIQNGQELGKLQAFVSPLEAVQLVLAKEEADIMIGQSTASLAIAEEQLRNLTSNDASQAVAGTRMQQLRETAEQARVAIREAKQKLQYLPAEPYDHSFQLEQIPLTSNLHGTVTEIHVTPRQFVAQGDPLYTVANWNSLWIEVPLFEADHHRVVSDAPAQVALPGIDTPVSARAVVVPTTTPPGSRMINRYYVIENPEGGLSPGRAISVSLPTSNESESILMPRSALVWDGFGSAWVYVRIEPSSFQRTRVELGSRFGDAIEIRRGVSEGAEVVTAGAQTLFSEEFRGQLQTEDDD